MSTVWTVSWRRSETLTRSTSNQKQRRNRHRSSEGHGECECRRSKQYSPEDGSGLSLYLLLPTTGTPLPFLFVLSAPSRAVPIYTFTVSFNKLNSNLPGTPAYTSHSHMSKDIREPYTESRASLAYPRTYHRDSGPLGVTLRGSHRLHLLGAIDICPLWSTSLSLTGNEWKYYGQFELLLSRLPSLLLRVFRWMSTRSLSRRAPFLSFRERLVINKPASLEKQEASNIASSTCTSGLSRTYLVLHCLFSYLCYLVS